MDWYTLEGLQEIAANRKIVICAWRPSDLDDLQNRYVWDKKGKVEDFKVPLIPNYSIRVIIEKDGKATIFHPDGTMDLKEYNPTQTPVQDKKEIFHLEMNGDRKKYPEKRKYRSMTFGEVKCLQYGDHPLIRLNNRKVGQVKVNGAVRLWKRDPARIEVPCKYGLYECFTFTARDIDRFLVELE
jgi:hypothetical protein